MTSAATLRASLARAILAGTGGPAHDPSGGIEGLMLIRIDRAHELTCGTYEPCVVLIVQGSKRVQLGESVLSYGVDRYLIASMNVPVKSSVVEARPDRPYLGVALKLDWREIAALMLEIPARGATALDADRRAVSTGAVNAALLGAFDRLLALFDTPEDIPSLAPLIKREIFYRLLTGDAGARLREIATVDTQSHQVARAIAILNAGFTQTLRVDQLAREAGMSLSTFHQHFKAHTAMSPLQYQKQLRLTEARRLMLSDHLDASTAAYRVGYESPSQFSREYRRLFGAPPTKDIADRRAPPPNLDLMLAT